MIVVDEAVVVEFLSERSFKSGARWCAFGFFRILETGENVL
jgi:hypothetical protein